MLFLWLVTLWLQAFTINETGAKRITKTFVTNGSDRLNCYLQEDKLTKGQTFQTGEQATHFIQDYCLNLNRQCKVTKSSGRSKTFACPQDGCPWEIRLTKRERVGGSPEHYISTLNDRHFDMCMAIAKPTARQIKINFDI